MKAIYAIFSRWISVYISSMCLFVSKCSVAITCLFTTMYTMTTIVKYYILLQGLLKSQPLGYEADTVSQYTTETPQLDWIYVEPRGEMDTVFAS